MFSLKDIAEHVVLLRQTTNNKSTSDTYHETQPELLPEPITSSLAEAAASTMKHYLNEIKRKSKSLTLEKQQWWF